MSELPEEIRVHAVQHVSLPIPPGGIDAVVDFYGGLLGLERNPLSSDEWPEFETGNVTILLSTPEQTGVSFSPSNTAIALRVPDVAEAKAKLEAAGVEVGEMWDSGVCHGAGISDPAGNRILLHHRYAPYPDGKTP